MKMIWSSMIDVGEWKDFLEECYPEVEDDCEKYEIIHQINSEYLQDEKVNLNGLTYEYPIICIANVGTWFGRLQGYKLLDAHKIHRLSDIFESGIGNDQEFFVEDGEVRCNDYHHDATNHYIFREMTCDPDDAFPLYATASGNMDQTILNRYSRSLAEDVCKIYGWDK